MKKHLSLLLLVAAFAFTASAQKKKSAGGNKLDLAFESAIPVGTNSTNSYSVGLGASLKFEAPIAEELNFTVSAGYTSMMYSDQVKTLLKAFGSSDTQTGFVPVKAGLKYFIAPEFYANAEFGAAIGTKSGVGTAFAYSPGVGYVFGLAGGAGIDVGARYEGWSKDGTLSFIGLHIAYKFAL